MFPLLCCVDWCSARVASLVAVKMALCKNDASVKIASVTRQRSPSQLIGREAPVVTHWQALEESSDSDKDNFKPLKTITNIFDQ